MIGGVTLHKLSHLPVVPHLHVNRPLVDLNFRTHANCTETFSAAVTRDKQQTAGRLQKNNTIGGFHAISGDTNNDGEMNKCWWTNKAS